MAMTVEGWAVRRQYIKSTWKHLVNPVIKISRDRYLNALLFADDLLKLQSTETDLEKCVFKFHQIFKQYNIKKIHYKNKGNGISKHAAKKDKLMITERI